MNEKELLLRLKGHQAKLDSIIAAAGRAYHEQHRHLANFAFDLSECQFELYNLSRNQDLCYDRPNTAFCYSLWYHGRRVNTFLSYFATTLFASGNQQIQIFDLGAGTGAVQWAVGLVYHVLKEAGEAVPQVRIINVDTSPFMLAYNRDYLWKHFVAAYPHCGDFTANIEYQVNSWNNSRHLAITNPWITASYLFDLSDTAASGPAGSEYKESVKAGFHELIKTFSPSNILLLTSDQPAKRGLLRELMGEFVTKGYHQKEVSNVALLLTGQLPETSRFRQELYRTYQDQLVTGEARSLNNPAAWNDFSFTGTVLSKIQTALSLFTPRHPQKAIKLYNQPITVRREVVLNSEQEKAAEHTERPTIITGPAGCGKSVVITQRIKNLVQINEYSPRLNILVTTFNKQLMSFLGNWLAELLDAERVTRHVHSFTFSGSAAANITLWHFDLLPTRIGRASGILVFNPTLRIYATQAIQAVKGENGITTNKHDKVLNPDYILEEYHRIVYGLQYVTGKEFLASERKGRPKLNKEGNNRKLLWKAVRKFLQILEQKGVDSIITRRHKFLKQLQGQGVPTRFSHIFVDEFQDCTQADYHIFDLLLEDPNHLVLAGDVAQAVHIGNVADIPRVRKEEMANRKTHYLKGSYRLPFRISECITPISQIIQGGNVITPYKGAPPGARPVVVYGSSLSELKEKMTKVYHAYKMYGIDEITILENDSSLNDALWAQGLRCNTDTILRLKGLEKTCVLWSTQTDIEYKEEVAEFVYTILSRTSGILIIALTPHTLPKYSKIMRLLRKDRLIVWDQETKNRFEDCCQHASDETIVPEDEE